MTQETAHTIAKYLLDGDHFKAEAYFMEFFPGTEGWLTDRFAEWAWSKVTDELEILYRQEIAASLDRICDPDDV